MVELLSDLTVFEEVADFFGESSLLVSLHLLPGFEEVFSLLLLRLLGELLEPESPLLESLLLLRDFEGVFSLLLLLLLVELLEPESTLLESLLLLRDFKGVLSLLLLLFGELLELVSHLLESLLLLRDFEGVFSLPLVLLLEELLEREPFDLSSSADDFGSDFRLFDVSLLRPLRFASISNSSELLSLSELSLGVLTGDTDLDLASFNALGVRALEVLLEPLLSRAFLVSLLFPVGFSESLVSFDLGFVLSVSLLLRGFDSGSLFVSLHLSPFLRLLEDLTSCEEPLTLF